MARKEIAHTVITLNDGLREFFGKINFHHIPEEAKYIAFFDDGEAAFLTNVETSLFVFPRLMVLTTSVHENVEVEFDDD